MATSAGSPVRSDAREVRTLSARGVEPTVRKRILTLDVLRGVAILGILLANIEFFAQPEFEQVLLLSSQQRSPLEAWTTAAMNAFVNGKFRTMLAVLFGVGVWLQFEKRRAIPNAWPGGYWKRTFYLAMIGLFHGVFIWWGDILFNYAIAAFLASLFVALEDRKLKLVMIGTWAAGMFFGVCMLGLVQLMTGRQAADVSDTVPLLFSSQRELEVFGAGSYWEQLGLRSAYFGVSMVGSLTYLLWLMPFFFLGILFGRWRLMQDWRARPKTFRFLLWTGLGIGLPLNLLSFLTPGTPYQTAFDVGVEILWGPILSVGLLMGLIAWTQSGRLMPVQRTLANVGRMALSNYIGQSIVCSILFYSWGIGLFGRLDIFEQLSVVAGVWGVNLGVSFLWLKRYTMGPLEWLWRCATESRWLPLRLADVAVPATSKDTPAFDV
jgi:uncharacterized protein